MADEYIRKRDAVEALADYIKNIDKVYSTGKLTQDECIDCAESVLDDLSSADVVPVVHAHWIRHENADIICGYYVPSFECSKCRAWKEDDSDFCPDCGSKMDGEE